MTTAPDRRPAGRRPPPSGRRAPQRRRWLILVGALVAAGCAGDHELATGSGVGGAIARWWYSDRPVDPPHGRGNGRATPVGGGDFEGRWNNNFYK